MSNRIEQVIEQIKPLFRFHDSLVMAFIGGSELHGAKLEGTDDTDLYGVYLEPPEFLLGLHECEHFVWSTSNEKQRNVASDVDVTFYSLKKWCRLAVKGNPTCLHFLYWRQNGRVFHPVWNNVSENYRLFLSKRSVKQFMGFANAQLQRMTGERGRGKHGQRPELEQEFGYDTKAAMHVIRLLLECREFIKTGEITLPRPIAERDGLIAIRSGANSEEWVIRKSLKLFQECKELAESSSLPEVPDERAISCLMTECYLRYWQEKGLNPV